MKRDVALIQTIELVGHVYMTMLYTIAVDQTAPTKNANIFQKTGGLIPTSSDKTQNQAGFTDAIAHTGKHSSTLNTK
jgi:hypothetical protein